MSKFLLIPVLTLLVGLLSLSSGEGVSAQDCERVVSGNAQSPCKQLNYLDGLASPSFSIEQFSDDDGDYYCQGILEWKSETPLNKHKKIKVAFSDSRSLSYTDFRHPSYHGSFGFAWPNGVNGKLAQIEASFIRILATERVYPNDPVREVAHFEGYYPSQEWPYFQFTFNMDGYVIVSQIFDTPSEVADYQLLMNQCLSGIARQLERDAAVEEARQLAQGDKVRAETAAEEAKTQAELAEIELASAEAALKSAEELNAALLQETILSIKREDAIRAAWQQVTLVRMAGLEERTKIWNDAVNRWAAEDLQFSTAMEARIQEVQRLQALNAALEQSMADQRAILIAQLEELEKAEQEALQSRESSN